jgi:long-chain acyl-CoA synthetase
MAAGQAGAGGCSAAGIRTPRSVLGYLEDGSFSIIDREKDMLRYKGYTVYPRQLEELLLAQPGVRAAAVIGRPDPIAGDVPVAFVVTDDPERLDPEQLRGTVNQILPPYQRIRELYPVETNPVV